MKKILYPIFLKCIIFALDPFWEGVFQNLAYGVCPTGAYLDRAKSAVYCCLKNKDFYYNFDSKPPEEIYNRITSLFKNKLKLTSEEEYYKNMTDFKKMLQFSMPKWSETKKKGIRDLMIERYVLKLRVDYGLSFSTARKILGMINTWFQFKILTEEDVVYGDRNEIFFIRGIVERLKDCGITV